VPVGIYTYKKDINHTTRTYSLDTNYKIQKEVTRKTAVEGIYKAMRGRGLGLWIVVGVENWFYFKAPVIS
jgi:abortive infection bacteriophage resistance protein